MQSSAVIMAVVEDFDPECLSQPRPREGMQVVAGCAHSLAAACNQACSDQQSVHVVYILWQPPEVLFDVFCKPEWCMDTET